MSATTTNLCDAINLLYGVKKANAGTLGSKTARTHLAANYLTTKYASLTALARSETLGLSEKQVNNIKTAVEKACTQSMQLTNLIATIGLCVNEVWCAHFKDFTSYVQQRPHEARAAQPNYTLVRNIVHHGISSGVDFVVIFMRSISHALKKAKQDFNTNNFTTVLRNLSNLALQLSQIHLVALVDLERHFLLDHKKLGEPTVANQDQYAMDLYKGKINTDHLILDQERTGLTIDVKALSKDRDFQKKIEFSKKALAKKIADGTPDEALMHGCPGSQLIVPLFNHFTAIFDQFVLPHIDQIIKQCGGNK